MNFLILPIMGQIIPLLFIYQDDFGVRYPMKIDMPLNEETETGYKILTFIVLA